MSVVFEFFQGKNLEFNHVIQTSVLPRLLGIKILQTEHKTPHYTQHEVDKLNSNKENYQTDCCVAESTE